MALTADGDEEQGHTIDSQQVIACGARLAAARRIAAGDRCEGAIGPADVDRSEQAPCSPRLGWFRRLDGAASPLSPSSSFVGC